MEPSRIDRYRKKLFYLKRYHDWLEDWLPKNSLDYIKENEDYKSLMGIYHTVQNAIACVIDIMAMMNKDLNNLVQDNYSNLEILIEKKIIRKELKQGIKELIGLRNRLAHDYNGIVDETAWRSIEENHQIFQSFYEGMTQWLNQQKQ